MSTDRRTGMTTLKIAFRNFANKNRRAANSVTCAPQQIHQTDQISKDNLRALGNLKYLQNVTGEN
jgi:hypothetical protein